MQLRHVPNIVQMLLDRSLPNHANHLVPGRAYLFTSECCVSNFKIVFCVGAQISTCRALSFFRCGIAAIALDMRQVRL